MSELPRRVREFMQKHRMLPPGQGPLVVAVSGGPDSMALLECMWEIFSEEASRRLIVAHLNHGLRASAARDAEFVKAEAARRGLRFFLGSADVKGLVATEGLSVEDAARRARYNFLVGVARDCGAYAVALGHTADDQAETVLFRLFRGAGLRGLGAMRPVRELAPGIALIRPLLRQRRSELVEFLAERGLSFCEDESNLDLRFRRNLIRHKILPYIKEFQPRIVDVLCRLAELAGEAADSFANVSRALFAKELDAARTGSTLELPLDVLLAQCSPIRAEAIRLGFAKVSGGRGLGLRHVRAIEAAMERPGRTVALPGGWQARAAEGKLQLLPPGTSPEEKGYPAQWMVEFPVPGQGILPDGRIITARVFPCPPGAVPPRLHDPQAEEWLDFDAIGRPSSLVVRCRRAGDVFHPLGYPGSRTLKRFFIDAKLPASERKCAVVVTTGRTGPILWLAPFRLDERARITSSTREVLALKLEPDPNKIALQGAHITDEK